MKRRDFLYLGSALLFSLLLDKRSVFAKEVPQPVSGEDILKGMMIIDAHSHPDEFFSDRFPRDMSSSMSSIKKLGMKASVFSAIGDKQRNSWEESFYGILRQLSGAMDFVDSGKARLILKASDITNATGSPGQVGCILGIEGANPLQGDLQHFDEVYRYGVRVITLGHYRVNEFTDIMTAPPKHGGLSPLGMKAIGKMDTLGIVIDVAHASHNAIKNISEITKKPLLDSHTSICHNNTIPCGRFRTWNEMELVAKTGGVVCTWPMARRKEEYYRQTFIDWAKEIVEMKKRLGMEHVGLGTDGGGHLPNTIQGYDDVLDLRKLASAMLEVGLNNDDIAAYMGGNFYRVFKAYTG
jgi:microsomal dipeptidase-like Zn-dependent dipeptidase